MDKSKDRALPKSKGVSIEFSESEIEETTAEILKVLRNIRVGVTFEEYRLQETIADLLMKANLDFKKEYKLAPRNRIDFFIEGGIGVEVKKGKPNSTEVVKQLKRYTSFSEINRLILVVERSVNIPGEINGKKCILFGLNRLWGVALR